MHGGVRGTACGRGGGGMNVRTLRACDAFPEGFATGFEKMPVQKSWIWIAEVGDETIGVLMAAPMHGLVYIMRLCIREGAPPATAFLLLRGFLRDTAQRGFKGFLMHITPSVERERRMIPMCKRAGGFQLLMPQVALVGSIEKAARF
jgi:hypothetical protein